MYKYIIFDFDGTLADSGDVAIKAINEMSKNRGFDKIKEEDISRLRKMNVKQRFKYLNVNPLIFPMLAKEYYAFFKKLIDDVELFEGMKELLNKLHHDGINVAIISSNSQSNIQQFLHNKQIKFIDKVLCSNNIFKKDRILKKFLKQNDLRKEQVIYVGDEIRDIRACKKIGIEIIWVDWGLDLAESVMPEEPDYIVSKPDDIYKIVKGG